MLKVRLASALDASKKSLGPSGIIGIKENLICRHSNRYIHQVRVQSAMMTTLYDSHATLNTLAACVLNVVGTCLLEFSSQLVMSW